jgi:hypothetical protein
MIKINYQFKTVGPLYTGSDINAGTLRTLRRQKCIIPESISYCSYLNDEQRIDAITHICMGVWKTIDFEKIKGKRLMRIWDEFTNKLLAAGRVATKQRFIETLCRSWGINSLTQGYVLRALDLLSDFELLETVRTESLYIVLKFRALKAALKTDESSIEKYIWKNIDRKNQEKTIMRREDMIPCISGNSIRGKMRRLIMSDFCRQVGIKKMDKKAYHVLFSGGFLDQSTKYDDFSRMEKFVSRCPPLGVLGAAIGNMTIEGEVKVGWAYPLCNERGTSDQSYWQYLDTVFQTRSDSSKTETAIELLEENETATEQMKYEYEVFADGTPFEHRIAFTSLDPLLISTFWHMLKLLESTPYLGGMGSVGNGEIKPDWNLAGNDEEYLGYLNQSQNEIKEFWENVNI